MESQIAAFGYHPVNFVGLGLGTSITIKAAPGILKASGSWLKNQVSSAGSWVKNQLSGAGDWVRYRFTKGLSDDVTKGTIDDAIASRDAAVAAIRQMSKTKQEQISTVVGGVNIKTGEVAVGFKVRGPCNGMCAEDIVTKALGGHPKDVMLTPAIRPKVRPHKSDVIPVCTQCQGTFTRDQFPPGTSFD
ncbi:hypothetical protein KDD30_15375 [Photobacterium sp. GJ3]|uniref:hypothetical protein n=1 Tax=Photobacterium sp. GJ3 TaxID=2829502 RepID=UPI001B8B7081|nr:hypothetical protein [Photobacterium sp. GJ3]QUJ67395.1 hypothetical protein KDD30_15375 [Photobacterium sp. GJ3]